MYLFIQIFILINKLKLKLKDANLEQMRKLPFCSNLQEKYNYKFILIWISFNTN